MKSIRTWRGRQRDCDVFQKRSIYREAGAAASLARISQAAFVVLVLTLFCLLFSAAAVNAEAERIKQPIYAGLSESYIEGRSVYEINFHSDMVNDKELIFKALSEEERPFRLSRPFDFKVFWKSPRILRLESQLSPRDYEDALDKNPLNIIWKKSLKGVNGNEFQGISSVPDLKNRSARPVVFAASVKNKNGEISNRLSLIPFEAGFQAAGDGRSVSLRFSFSRLMVEADQLGTALTMAEAPFTLEPHLPLEGYWRDQRTLVFNHRLSREDFWRQVSDIPFSIKWKRSFKNLHGQVLPQKKEHLKPFFFSKFSVLGFNQSAMNLDGWADFDIGFNKPVNKADLAASLQVEKYVYENGQTRPVKNDSKRNGYKAAEFKVIEAPSDDGSDGTVFRVKVKGDHGERIRLLTRNLKPSDGRGLIGRIDNDSWIDRFFTISNTAFNVEEKYPWRSYFTVDVHEALKFDNIEKYIKLDPPMDFTVSPYGQEGQSIQIFAPFSSEVDTKVTLKRGLSSQRGVLTEDVEYTVVVPSDSDRKLMFTGRGRYLSPGKPLLVKLAGRNIKKVRLQAWRVYENNLPTIINVQEYDHNVRLRLAQQFSDNLLDRESPTQALPGQTFERLVNLEGLLGDKPKGAYILKCSPVKSVDNNPDNGQDEYYDDGDYYSSYYDYSDYYYHTERYLPVMISDIGLSAHVLPGQMSVRASSLSSARPVAGGRVKFYDRANQLVSEGLTDADGVFTAPLNPAKVIFATVEKDGDLNYLTFGSSARISSDNEDFSDEEDYYYDRQEWYDNGNAKWYGGDGGYLPVDSPASSFGPMRDYLIGGYEAFLFMPRDMFKPGESVTVKAIVRDRDILPPRESFPVLWRVEDPDGKAVASGRTNMNEQGGLDFKAEIPFSARTGSYSAAIYLPGSSLALGQVKFTVEDFVPPRLALEIKPEEEIYQGEHPEISLKADVKYLFGAPGANLNWELDAVIFPSSFNPAGWSGFDFSSPRADFQTTRQRQAAKGRLDELGQATVSYSPGLDIERLPNKTSIEFVFSAQEDGGRWNAKKARVDYFPRDLILGSKSPQSPMVKEPFDFEVAALTPGGKAAETSELTVRVFRVMTRYYNSYRYGRHYRQATEELVEKQLSQVALVEGRGGLRYTPEAAGPYEIHISDEASGQVLKRRVYVYGLASEKEALSARAPVEISFDREHYLPGEKARVRVKSPFKGHLWLTVETTEVLYSIGRDMEGDEIELEIPVTGAIKTNAQVTATVVRPLADNISVFRAVGAASLEIDRSIYKLQVAADMDGRIKPSAPARLKIRVTDEQGRPVAGEATVALVDEGVLSLTNFKTPEPWRLFVAGRHMLTRFYDLYDQLLPLERNVIPFLAAGGGDGLGRSGLFSPFKRNQEILSIFIPSVQLDAQGEAEIELNLPEYSGQGRLMVVASGRDRFGSVSRDIRISRDLTAEATMPLAVAPGDRFEIPIRLFLAAEAGAEAGREAGLVLRTEGPVKIVGEKSASFNLEPGQGRSTVFQALAEPAAEGGDRAGVGRLIIDSKSGVGESASQTIEVVVRPPYPRVAKTIGTQLEDEETTIVIDTSAYLKGTAEASLTLAKSPAVEAARAVNWLKSYPYGCLEQTTSKAWAFVAAEDILQGLEPKEEAEKNIYYGLNTAVQRLTTMQTVNGGFATWPGGNYVYDWGSVYAAHFLTEAGNHIELPRNLKDRTLEWLQSYLSSGYGQSTEDASYILAAKAYALYVLALNGRYENGWYNSLKDRYDGLSPSAKIFLAGARALRDGNSQALQELEREKLDLAYNNLSARRSSLDSGPRNLALKLLVWTEVDPLSEVTKKLAQDVAAQGRLNLWSNTQENGLAVLAMGKYLDKSGLGKPYQATLSGPDGRTIFKAGPADMASAGPKALASGLDKKMNLKIEGEGRPYYTLTIAGVPVEPPPAKAEGIKLSRAWIMGDRKISLSGQADMSEALVFDKGDRVTVEIEVETAKSIQNLVLVDILPGGFEIENPRLVAPAENDEGENETNETVESTRLEMREDRLVIIEPWIGAGRSKYRYSLRAVTSGDYILPGTSAEGMYEPDRQAVLPTGRVKVN